MITDLKMVESYGCIKADNGEDALKEFALSQGFDDLMEFASTWPMLADDLIAVQLH
ncbi:hypothetical protein [Paraburkholderia monticola]|uniref:hypothetical protein n=1 Tax=Paraburkholderia monticola TaxID=1399968 RepID=UPI0013A54CF6|nr:hypothetical protein [Paraburkholderia monticola]